MARIEGSTMNRKSTAWPPSSILLIIAGILLAGTGLYFMILRPPLLPEDTRFMGIAAAHLDPLRPGLDAWLNQVFRLATGVLAATLVATSFRQHSLVAAVGALVGGAASIGWMAVVNFTINSDFKWVLLAMALVWAASLVLFWLERRTYVSVSGLGTIDDLSPRLTRSSRPRWPSKRSTSASKRSGWIFQA
jgi:hypothetical protein